VKRTTSEIKLRAGLRFFNSVADEYSAHHYGKKHDLLTYEMQFRRRVVFEMLDAHSSKKGKLLDAGCGPATLVRDFLARGYDVWGIDCSKRMIEEARRNISELNDHFAQGDIENMAFPSESFDIVVSLGVLHYLKDERPSLREIRRVLKPGGLSIVSISNAFSPSQIIRKMLAPMRTLLGCRQKHSAFFSGVNGWIRSPWSIDHFLKDIGLRKVTSRFVGSAFMPCNITLPPFYERISNFADVLSKTWIGSEYLVLSRKAPSIQNK
jgi:ubiquinone/menaquinone biosynthesis C-methylase UbiE